MTLLLGGDAMEEINSILKSIRKRIGLNPEEATEFDPDLIDAINSAIAVLTQVGIGPVTGFSIHDESQTWDELLGDDPRFNMAKTYVFDRCRLIFDTSSMSSYVLSSIQDRIREFEWRLNVAAETPNTFPPLG